MGTRVTGNALIRRALRILGVLAAESPLPAADGADGLVTLNGMIRAWQGQRLTLYVVQAYTYDLVSGQQDYTIGPGGHFDQVRPMTIERVSIISYQNPDQPLEMAIDPIFDTQQWQAISTKNVTSALPVYVYYEPTFPLGTLKYFPVPYQQPLSTRLYIPTPLQQFANGTTDYTFPPVYEEALVYQLAKRLAIEYGRPFDGDLKDMANEAIAVMKRTNITLVDLELDPALLWRRRYFNWLSGDMS